MFAAIADDVTGGSDLAIRLANRGLRTVQCFGTPRDWEPSPDVEAVVISLKSRSVDAPSAVAMTQLALQWFMRRTELRRLYFKYGSTFDSTADGNIGPVIGALLDGVGQDLAITCPALPAQGRTVRHGHLFIHGVPLDRTTMRHHPLNPMTSSDLVELLSRQTALSVGRVDIREVLGGEAKIRQQLARLAEANARIAVVDAETDQHLRDVWRAVEDRVLVTGSAGLPSAGLVPLSRPTSATFDRAGGASAILVGSMSATTRRQVAYAGRVFPYRTLSLSRLRSQYQEHLDSALAWAAPLLSDGPVMLSSDPGDREHDDHWVDVAASSLVERALADIARGLFLDGVRSFVVAGGETSASVLGALGVDHVSIGPEIDDGVPWLAGLVDGQRVNLALKSGNFGADDFFLRACKALT